MRGMMAEFQVFGMSCAACSARVEKKVSETEGVTRCVVSLLTNSMTVEGTASNEAVIASVQAAGYDARFLDTDNGQGVLAEPDHSLEDTKIFQLRKRLISSVVFLVLIMYVSMGQMFWKDALPSLFQKNVFAVGIYEMLLTLPVLWINRQFFINGTKGFLHKAPNMDSLVSLGAGASFLYSLVSLIIAVTKKRFGDGLALEQYSNDFYFESAASILTLITVGKMLEERAKGKTTSALKGLIKLSPKTALVQRNNTKVTVPIEEVQVGDIFFVRPGETVPTDGEVLEGISSVNEASLTGESLPVDKKPGDIVSAATLNQEGYLTCKATRVGKDTLFSQIIQMVRDASSTKAKIAKLADQIASVFVPAVLIVALITFAVWLILGQSVGFSLTRAVSVLVISCPCALGLATPVAIMVGTGRSAKHGILFKTAVSLEETGRVSIVALDKTGTITKGEPAVCKIKEALGVTAEELLSTAFSLEQKSEHPLAKAIVSMALEKNISQEPVEDFKAEVGNGLQGVMYAKEPLSNGEEAPHPVNVIGGNYEFVSKTIEIPTDMKEEADREALLGHTPLFFAKKDRFLGIIFVSDSIKEDSVKAIRRLKKLGIFVAMLTGDNEKTAHAIASEVGVDAVFANVLPHQKKEIIEDLQKNGKVAMVGDGINDALALTAADVGIAVKSGADVAIDAADLVLMKNSLLDVPAAILMSKKTFLNIKENLFWAFIYNIIGIPLAAGVYIHVTGWAMNPMFCAAAMGLSSFCVVSNALRLNLVDLYDVRKYKATKKTMKEPLTEKSVKLWEEKKMTIHVNGMMCIRCEAHVKEALEALDEVVEAIPNHETNTVELKTNCPISTDLLREVITKAGYEFEE